jgi:hypothetical protein
MSDYEGPPLKWDWSPSIAVSDLNTKLSNTNSRLISAHRPDGAAGVPFTAVWIANEGTDKTDWNWNPGTTAANLDSLVKKAGNRLIHIDAYALDGTGVQFGSIMRRTRVERLHGEQWNQKKWPRRRARRPPQSQRRSITASRNQHALPSHVSCRK